MTIGEKIKQRRKDLNITVDELAEALGKNRATIYRYENNEIEKLPTDVIEPLSKILKATPAYFLGWTDCVTEHRGFFFGHNPFENTSDDSFEKAWDDEAEKLNKEIEYNDELLISYLKKTFDEEEEIRIAFEIITQFPKLNQNGLKKLEERLNELFRLDEYKSNLE